MATLRIVASSYQLSNTSYTNISNPNNMYTNVDSTTYATFNHTRNQTTSYYLYIRGFNLSQIPSNATISSVIVKVKALVTGAGSYTPGLYNNTTSLNKNFNGSIGTSATTRTVDITSSWNTYKTYGNNLTIRLQLNRSNKNTASSMRIYGAEITVEYTVPTPRTITTSGTNCTVTPSGTTTVYDGDSFTLKIEGDQKPTVTDNGVDVTNKLVESTGTVDYSVETASGASYGFTVNSNGYYESTNKGQASTTSLCVVSMNLPVSCTVVFKLINYAESTYDYGLLSNVDTTLSTSSSADSTNVFWSGRSNNSSSEQTVSYGSIQAGQHSIYVKYFKDSYTDSYNDTLQFKVEITPDEPIGDNVFWLYTINPVTSNHTINAVSVIADEPIIYLKENGTWQEYILYKKINGIWVKQLDPDSILDSSAKYLVVDL